jgi:hypothetical protein
MNRRGAQLTGPLGGSGLVGLWGASGLIRSIQTATIYLPSGTTSATATISAVYTANTILLPCGTQASTTTGNPADSLMESTLTNTTTVTSQRYQGPSNNAYARSMVLEFVPGVIKSIQYVTWTYVGTGDGNTAAISGVNTGKSVLIYLGGRQAVGAWQTQYFLHMVQFNSATQLGIAAWSDPYGSGFNAYPRVAVVEFF